MKIGIISATLNEAENVPVLIVELERVLADQDFEVIISDDASRDRTWARVEEIGREDPRVRVLRRQQNPGLGWSVMDGFSVAAGTVCCIDADLHDPAIIPRMIKELTDGADVVVGTSQAGVPASGDSRGEPNPGLSGGWLSGPPA